jgi:hypothetical protein
VLLEGMVGGVVNAAVPPGHSQRSRPSEHSVKAGPYNLAIWQHARVLRWSILGAVEAHLSALALHLGPLAAHLGAMAMCLGALAAHLRAPAADLGALAVHLRAPAA